MNKKLFKTSGISKSTSTKTHKNHEIKIKNDERENEIYFEIK